MPTPDGLPLIGITCSIAPNQDPAAYPTVRPYVQAVRDAGGEPFIFHNDLARIAEYRGKVDGVLFAGGADLGVSLYGGDPNARNLGAPDTDRDQLEQALLPVLIAAGLPLFLICRGLQTLNVVEGGTLNEDIPDHRQTEHGLARSDYALGHTVIVDKTSRFAELLRLAGCPLRFPTNSLHHQSVAKISPKLRAVARAEDGTIEALEPIFPYPFMIAVQWHPEELRGDQISQALFGAFLKAAREYARVAAVRA